MYLLSYSGSLPICPVKTEICVIFQKRGISRALKLFGRTSKMAKVEYEAVRECPFSQTLRYAQKIILGISTRCLR